MASLDLQARDRITSLDEDLLDSSAFGHCGTRLNELETVNEDPLSSSWPSAGFISKRRPAPPRAPPRKPSTVTWDAPPPLILPPAPKRLSNVSKATIRTASTSTEEGGLLDAADDFEAGSDGEDQGGVFDLDDDLGACDSEASNDYADHSKLDDEASDDDKLGQPSSQLDVGAHDEEASSPGFVRPRARTTSFSATPNPPMGASPMLMNVLERMSHSKGEEGCPKA